MNAIRINDLQFCFFLVSFSLAKQLIYLSHLIIAVVDVFFSFRLKKLSESDAVKLFSLWHFSVKGKKAVLISFERFRFPATPARELQRVFITCCWVLLFNIFIFFHPKPKRTMKLLSSFSSYCYLLKNRCQCEQSKRDYSLIREINSFIVVVDGTPKSIPWEDRRRR